MIASAYDGGLSSTSVSSLGAEATTCRAAVSGRDLRKLVLILSLLMMVQQQSMRPVMKMPEQTRVTRLGRNHAPGPASPDLTRLTHLSSVSSPAPQLTIPSHSRSLLTQGPVLPSLQEIHQTSEVEQLLRTGVTTSLATTAAWEVDTRSQRSISFSVSSRCSLEERGLSPKSIVLTSLSSSLLTRLTGGGITSQYFLLLMLEIQNKSLNQFI